MQRYSLLVAAAALVATVMLAFPLASSSQTAFTWSGTWNTTYGTMTLTQTGSEVEGNYALESGHLSGTVTGNVLEGRWDEAPRATDHDKGPFKFTLITPTGQSFSGTWGHDDTGPYPDPWNGDCTSGACKQNGTAAPPTTPLTPRSVRPVLGAPISYKAPEPGKTAKLPTPVLGPKTKAAVVDVATAGANGSIHPAPPVAGVVLTRAQQEEERGKPVTPDDIRAEKAFQLCYILAIGADLSREGLRAFIRCAITVQEILRRADEIKAKRGALPTHTAQAGSCRSLKPNRRAKRRLRPALRVKCAPTAAGLRLTFRKRKGGPSLRKLFGRKSRLVVGRSRFDVPAGAGDRTNVLWRTP